jgi:hypothetical protein
MLRRFFDVHLRPNYEEWLASPLDERQAMNALAAANNMAAWALHYWSGRDSTKVYGIRKDKESEYRHELATRECPDFALVRDVAEAHKHFHLLRKSPPRHATRSDQTQLGATGWGEGGYGEGVYGGGPQLVVTLDDGTERPLAVLMGKVITMWEQLLARWGL